jgi:hypothetical protein
MEAEMGNEETEQEASRVVTWKSYLPSRTALVVLGAIVAIGVLEYSALALPAHTYTSVIKEDRWIEGSGALALLAGSIFFLLAYLHARKRGGTDTKGKLGRLCLLGLAVLFFVGFGEEFSWGERIFGYGGPSGFASVNGQGEVNLHNLKVLDEGWLNPDHMFMLFWVGFGVLVPLAYAFWGRARRFFSSFQGFLPILPLIVSAALVANQFMYWGTTRIFDGRFFNPHYDLVYSAWETKESIAEIALTVGAFYVYNRLRKRTPEPGQFADGRHEAMEAASSTNGRSELQRGGVTV